MEVLFEIILKKVHYWGIRVDNKTYFISNEKLKRGDYFFWKEEIHKFHSDAGYGIKTYTCFNKKDGSSVIINQSNVRGKIVATSDLSLNLPNMNTHSYFL